LLPRNKITPLPTSSLRRFLRWIYTSAGNIAILIW
jgi:hypothetical protein